jgi:hypothetical protein
MQLCRAALLQTDRHFYIFRIPWLRVQQLPHLIQLLMISCKICLQLLHAIELTGADAILAAEGLQRPSNDDEEEAMG